MYLKIFPQYSNDSNTLNISEIQRITDIFAKFSIPSNDTFGPYDLLNFTLLGPYSNGMSLKLCFYAYECMKLLKVVTDYPTYVLFSLN